MLPTHQIKAIFFFPGYSLPNNLSPNKILNLVKLSFELFFNRIPYGPHVIPFHLCHDLDAAKTCDCGRFCLNSFIQGITTMNLHSIAHTVVLLDNVDGTQAPVSSYFCSLTCYINSSDMLK